MSKEFINPNLHVILIHYPLALLGLGTLIELFAFLWRKSAVRIAGRWMILFGAIALVPAATAGLYAMAQVNRGPDTALDATWSDVRQASPIQGPAWEMMTDHVWLNAAGAAVILIMVVLWLGSSDVWRSRLHLLYLLILLGGYGLIVAGAWHGGELVYKFGVGVESTHASPGNAPEHSAEHSAAQAPPKRDINYYMPPMELHVILAGLAVAVGLVAIGASMRAGVQVAAPVAPTPELADIGAALNPNIRSISVGGTLRNYDDVALRGQLRRAPIARFWLVAALLAISAGLTGWWTLANNADIWKFSELLKQVTDPSQNGDSFRRLAHGITTGVIVFLMLFLAALSRWIVGRRFVLGLLSLLLVAAVASQVWFGSLLMFDTNVGRIDRFNGTEAPAAPTNTPAKTPAKSPETTPPPATTKPATTTATSTPAARAERLSWHGRPAHA